MRNIKSIYEIVNQKSDFLFEKYDLLQFSKQGEKNEWKANIVKQRLYELNMNICNSYLYGHKCEFSKDEMYFIEEYNLYDLIKEFTDLIAKDVEKYKKGKRFS